MDRHIDRWGGDYDGWMANVDEIHDFIEERCAEMLINGLEDCYEVESVTLTLIIDGMGEVQVNSVDIGPFDVPMDATYFAGVPMELTAQETLGEVFLFWQVVEGDITLNDPTNPYLGFTLSGDATLVAYFASNADPQEVTFIVEPAGAGEIYVDGTALVDYPATELLEYGAHNVQAVGLDEWHVFTGWSSTGPQVAPSMANPAGSISVTEPATYTAHFNVIEHSDLKVRVEPPNKGVVRIEGGAVIVTDEWEGGLEIAGLLNAEAAPVENWAFDRWEIANSAPNPSANAANITLPKQDQEELVAYFVPIDFAVYVPTAFSPNNDGLNDAFLPVGTSFVAETYHLIVINRWGEKVFESFDP
ncbi:MAG: InlB B-repeat-containing protein, partial [Flavobacteriales bacterium]